MENSIYSDSDQMDSSDNAAWKIVAILIMHGK